MEHLRGLGNKESTLKSTMTDYSSPVMRRDPVCSGGGVLPTSPEAWGTFPLLTPGVPFSPRNQDRRVAWLPLSEQPNIVRRQGGGLPVHARPAEDTKGLGPSASGRKPVHS